MSFSDLLAEVDDPMNKAEAAEALSAAEIEAQTLRQALLRDCISASEAAQTTGRSRQALERLRRANRLIALRTGRQWRYPRWQFDPDAPGGILPGLGQVISDLQLSPAGAAWWLLQPSKQLNGAKPLELLRRHQPAPVVELGQAWMP
jgi:hypothetical protein